MFPGMKFSAEGKNIILDIEVKGALQVTADRIRLAQENDNYDLSLLVPTAPLNLQETLALCSLFGMERAEVYSALHAVDSLLHPKQTVEVVE